MLHPLNGAVAMEDALLSIIVIIRIKTQRYVHHCFGDVVAPRFKLRYLRCQAETIQE